MNEHIELVKKWLADPKSVIQKELDENAKDACAAAGTAYRAAACAADWAAYRAADWAADWAAYRAVYRAAKGDIKQAKYWVDEYEQLTNNKNKRA